MMDMNEEESMPASFRALMKLHAYRELTGEEESFFELYPEYVVKRLGSGVCLAFFLYLGCSGSFFDLGF